MTANAAGSNLPKLPRLAQPAITNPLLPWYLVIPSFVGNSMPSSKPSAKGASSKLPPAGSVLEASFARLLRAHKLPEAVREYRFDAVRKWRFDFAWPDQKVAVELHGGIWAGGRHSGGKGQLGDMDKTNAAQLQGWLVLTFAAEHLKDGTALEMTWKALGISA